MKSNLLKPLLVTFLCVFISSLEINAQVAIYNFKVKDSWEPKSGRGYHLYLKIKNASDKTIRKLFIRYVLIDRVGEVWYYNGFHDLSSNYTGPLKPGRTTKQYHAFASPRNDLAAFPRYVYVQYMDGTTDAIQITEANIKTYFPNLKWQNVCYNNLAFNNTNPYDPVVAQNNPQNQGNSIQSDETPSASVPPVPVQTVPQQTTKLPSSDVDVNIPQVSDVQKNTFAIIIANEDYQDEAKVDYAMNDGEVFRDYCHKILGLPEMNIHFVPNATLNNLIGELDWLQQLCEKYKGEASVIFYYVGHGVPDEASGSAYLLPTDGRSRMLRTCFSINELYETLGKLLAKQVTVLMDACFSGSQRNGGMLVSARGVAIKAKTSVPKGNMIVLSAAQGDETAYKYDETGHGLFTYFLLKKLKDTKGNVTMGELSSYLQDQVGRHSIVVNSKSQTPSITASPSLQNTWRNLKLK